MNLESRRRIRPPILRNNLILPSINNLIYSIDFSDDEEKHEEILNNIPILSQRERAADILTENRKEKKELKFYKHNYRKMMDNIPMNIIKQIVRKDRCSICLNENVEFNENYVITSCFHTFHEKCLKESQNFNDTCPLCRTNLKNSYYKKFQINVLSKGTDSF